MKMRSMLSGWALALALASPVAAAPYNTLISATAFNGDDFNGDTVYYGPYTESAYAQAASGAGYSFGETFAASVGGTTLGGQTPLLRIYSESALAGGNTQGMGRAAWEDYLDFSNAAAGTSGVITYNIGITGEVFSTGGGYWDFEFGFGYGLAGAGQTYRLTSSTMGSGAFEIDHVLQVTLAYSAGQVIPINGYGRAFSGVTGTGSAVADFSHTIRWLGVDSIITSTGEDVTDSLVIISGSNFDYQTAPGIPESGTWALMIMGFGLCGASLRRGRIRLA